MSSGHHQTSPSSSPAPLPFDRVEVLRLKDTNGNDQRLNDVSTKTPVTVSPVGGGGGGGRGSVVFARRTPDWIPRGSATRSTVHRNEAQFTRGPPTSRLQVSERVTPGGGGRKTSHLGAAERDGAGTADMDERTSNRSISSSALGMNIGLIVGIASGVILLVFVLAYAVFKYLSSQGEGSYKLDGTDKYCFEAYSESKTVTTTSATPRTTTTTTSAGNAPMTTKTKQIKEWYV